jgi:hypothetical protein
MNTFNRFVIFVAVTLTMMMSVGCSSTGGHRSYGEGPQGSGFRAGDYALEEARSLERIQEFASCDGQGYTETHSQSETGERNGRPTGYDVRIRQRGSCVKMGGQILPPPGMRRNRDNRYGPSGPGDAP